MDLEDATGISTQSTSALTDSHYNNITDRFLSTLQIPSSSRGSNYRSFNDNIPSRTHFPYYPRSQSNASQSLVTTAAPTPGRHSGVRGRGRRRFQTGSHGIMGIEERSTNNTSIPGAPPETPNPMGNRSHLEFASDVRVSGNRSSPFVLRQDNFMMFRTNTQHTLSMPSDSNDTSLMLSSLGSDSFEADSFDTYDTSEFDISQPSSHETRLHQVTIAKALGFSMKQRFLKFKPLKKNKRSSNTDSNMIQINEHHQSSIQHARPLRTRNKSMNPTNPWFRVITEVPSRILEAPDLKDDFYTNLVSWSKISHKLVIGLADGAYTWDNLKGAIPLQTVRGDPVTCVSLSHSEILAVGTKMGRLMIYDHDSTVISTTGILKPNSGICCICWIPNSLMFFAGDTDGDVTLYEIQKQSTPEINIDERHTPQQFQDSLTLKIKTTIKCSQTQVCGIDINLDMRQIAVGGNDNWCLLWDISDLNRPRLTSSLRHHAAVKAIAYCPWIPNLLATGGGTKDRNIRFWHSKSGALLDTFKAPGQLTSLIWSRSRREILATYGFGDVTGTTTLIAVYSYPKMDMKIKISAPSGTRVLSASLSFDYSSIVTATSDRAVNLYKIWKSGDTSLNVDCVVGSIGSNLIELEEGFNNSFEILR